MHWWQLPQNDSVLKHWTHEKKYCYIYSRPYCDLLNWHLWLEWRNLCKTKSGQGERDDVFGYVAFSHPWGRKGQCKGKCRKPWAEGGWVWACTISDSSIYFLVCMCVCVMTEEEAAPSEQRPGIPTAARRRGVGCRGNEQEEENEGQFSGIFFLSASLANLWWLGFAS